MGNLRVFPLILLLFISGCKKGEMNLLGSYYDRLDSISQQDWDSLAQKKIYFGHRSVGQNIIAGLNDVLIKYPAIKLDIRETTDPESFRQPVFAHSGLGQNKLPESKINAFRDVMENGVGQNTDIAFLKFCFVDIDHTTDLQATFNSYVKTVERLEARFPETKIITFTVPLVSQPVGLIIRLKKILGRLPWYETDHVQRNIFNDMLRARFKDSLFDLAAIESRISDTKKASISKDGRRYDILRQDFTDDGGHLNSLGRQIVAIELLCYLATIAGE